MNLLTPRLGFNLRQKNIDASQFALPIGNQVVLGGLQVGEPRAQGVSIFAHQSSPDLQGPSVGLSIPKAGQTNYPRSAPLGFLIHETLRSETIENGTSFLVRPVESTGQIGTPVQGRIVFTFDDLLQFTPDAPLAPNTTYQVELPAGGIKDAAGNGMLKFTLRFSTGSSLITPSASPSPQISPSSTPTQIPQATPSNQSSPTAAPPVVVSPTSPSLKPTIDPARRARLIKLLITYLKLWKSRLGNTQTRKTRRLIDLANEQALQQNHLRDLYRIAAGTLDKTTSKRKRHYLRGICHLVALLRQ